MIDFDIDISFDSEEPKPSDAPKRTKSRGHATCNKDLFRRFTSERALEECCDWELSEGHAYHVISAGDIDSLTFLKLVVRQTKVRRLYVSTWCMSLADIEEIERLVELGRIGNVEWYVGEIFPGSYVSEYEAVKAFVRKHGGRVCVYRNHSKVYAFEGDRLSGAIESSANINTNPRAEQTVITIDEGLYRFYADYFDGIKSFDRITESEQ